VLSRPLRLKVLINYCAALHSLIFQFQTSFGYEPQLVPIHNALANWKAIWLLRSKTDIPGTELFSVDQITDMSPHDMWKRIGFMRNAPEFWLLAKIVLERLESARKTAEIADSVIGVDDRRGSLSQSVLDKYDETSMNQVNELIKDFQRVVL
jgi:hypothetical protein